MKKYRIVIETISVYEAQKRWEDPFAIWEWTVEDGEGSVTGGSHHFSHAENEAWDNIPKGTSRDSVDIVY